MEILIVVSGTALFFFALFMLTSPVGDLIPVRRRWSAGIIAVLIGVRLLMIATHIDAPTLRNILWISVIVVAIPLIWPAGRHAPKVR